jgi:hypothetical protein
MAARFRHLPARTAYGPYDVDERFEDDELWPGERVAPPPSRSRGVLRRLILILIVAGGGWAIASNQAALPDWWSVETAVASLKTHIEARLAESAKSASAATPARVEPQELPPIVELPVSSRDPIPPGATAVEVAPLTTASLPPAAVGSGEPAAQPLPPPKADPANPYQVRASAVGLHPELSRVVLERLSAADYRNAGIAIETALKETPDGDVYVWPRQRKPELALFTVRFVAGAAPSCRRYVVTVTKDGWLTTAPPMEKCGGPKPRQAKRG